MRTRRSRMEICARILETILEEEGALTKTYVMYRANISFKQLQKYLSLLLELEMIRIARKENSAFYEATEKGKLFLESFKTAKGLMTVKEKEKARAFIRGPGEEAH